MRRGKWPPCGLTRINLKMAESCDSGVSSLVTCVMSHGQTTLSDTNEEEETIRCIIPVEDSTPLKLPSSLEDYIIKLDEKTTHHEYLIALFIILFSECGFYVLPTLEENFVGNNEKLRFTPPNQWKVTEDTYEIRLVMKDLPNVVCKLIATASGNRLILNFFSTTKEKNVSSLAIKTFKYVNPFPRYIADRYMNVKEISNRFKNELVMGVRSDILTEAGIINPSLRGLPIELKFKILEMLNAPSLMRLSECSHEFNTLCKEPWLWQKLFRKDFGEKQKPSHESWQSFYCTKYIENELALYAFSRKCLNYNDY